ncbi:MAG: DUF5615 family PIN-like protein, partial [Roseiarcus sp.]
MRFLIDAQLPPALARRLVELGHDADQQLAAVTDSQIWDYALATAAVIVSKDEDFACVNRSWRTVPDWCGFASGTREERAPGMVRRSIAS